MAGAKVIRTEKNVRGPFGQVVKWSFILFNLIMPALMLSFCANVGKVATEAASDAEVAGAGLGGAIGGGFLLFIWLGGAVILGLITMMTKGKRIVVEETVGE